MRVAGIVLAAGEGRRMGGPKAFVRLGDESFLARACRLLADAGIDSVVAVLGAQAARAQAEAGVPARVRVVVNEAWRDGMLSSVWLGLDAVETDSPDAVLLLPVDHPFVTTETIRRVRAALESGAPIAVPVHDGRRGHPGGFARALLPELRAASPERGARAVLATQPGRVVHVPGDPGCVEGIDTPEDLERALLAG
jgi:CTP:molybdopterin cytidylyltransferase MocA